MAWREPSRIRESIVMVFPDGALQGVSFFDCLGFSGMEPERIVKYIAGSSGFNVQGSFPS
jgi:hypothetical protein